MTFLLLSFILLCLLLGLIGGVLSSAVGVGTGFMAIPFLLYFLPKLGIAPDILPHVVIGTTTVILAASAIFSSVAHHKHQNINWTFFRKLMPTGILGVLIGMVAIHFVPPSIFHLTIGFVFVFCLILMCIKKPNFKEDKNIRPLEGIIMGLIIGLYSVFFGLTNTLLTPYLNYRTSLKRSIGSSMPISILLLVISSALYIITGIISVKTPNIFLIGYIYWPAFIAVSSVGYFGAKYGAHLTQIIPAPLLKKIVICLLCMITIKILYPSF